MTIDNMGVSGFFPKKMLDMLSMKWRIFLFYSRRGVSRVRAPGSASDVVNKSQSTMSLAENGGYFLSQLDDMK